MRAYRDGQIIAASKLGDLALVSETCSHDDGLVTIFLVVVEDGLHAAHTWIFLGRVVFLHGGLIPVENSANERRDEVGTSFCGRDGLRERKHEGQVTVDSMLALQGLCRLDAFPCRGELDQDSFLLDANRFIELGPVRFPR